MHGHECIILGWQSCFFDRQVKQKQTSLNLLPDRYISYIRFIFICKCRHIFAPIILFSFHFNLSLGFIYILYYTVSHFFSPSKLEIPTTKCHFYSIWFCYFSALHLLFTTYMFISKSQSWLYLLYIIGINTYNENGCYKYILILLNDLYS